MKVSSVAPKMSLHRTNRFLFACIVLVNSLTILLIFYPSLMYVWESRNGTKEAALQSIVDSKDSPRKGNWLIVPRMHIDEKIYTGDDPVNLKRGAWLRPHTSTPDRGSNTVIAGHRTAFSRPPVFYHLDKLRPNDRFAIIWKDKKYVYEVVSKTEVSPGSATIEQRSNDKRVTLYTCTPLGTALRRLVVVARSVEI